MIEIKIFFMKKCNFFKKTLSQMVKVFTNDDEQLQIQISVFFLISTDWIMAASL